MGTKTFGYIRTMATDFNQLKVGDLIEFKSYRTNGYHKYCVAVKLGLGYGVKPPDGITDCIWGFWELTPQITITRTSMMLEKQLKENISEHDFLHIDPNFGYNKFGDIERPASVYVLKKDDRPMKVEIVEI